MAEGCATKQGQCDPPCSSSLECCGGFCVNIMSDDENCGECGNACDDGAHCTAGICPEVCGADVCTVTQTCCNDECVDLTSDPDHCGECDSACDPGWECLDSTCEHTECDPACAAGEICCSIPGGDPVCADLDNDREHCGACRNECAEEESCSDGICTETPCEPPCGGDPYRCCGGTCIDVDTDMENCGYCGNECDPLAADEWFGGACVCNRSPDCNVGQKCCPGVGCRNIMADPNNCGDCGTTCDTGLTCTDGECLCGGLVCEEGFTCCSGGCRDLQTDRYHCGECGHSCGVNAPTCVDGGCLCGDDPPCATACGFIACSDMTPPGPYEGCEVCCPERGGCLPMGDTSCGNCDTSCEGGEICIPVLGFFTCTFQCQPWGDTATDVVMDSVDDTIDDASDIPLDD